MLRVYIKLLRPVIDRLAVGGAGALVMWGADQDTATQFMTAVASVVVIGVELVLSLRNKKAPA